jgi:hypothetical protein
MDAQLLITRMLELPTAIAKVQYELITLNQKSQETSNRIMKCETALKVMIAGMTEDGGKKKYSNEDARRAAFAEMAEDDLDLNELKRESAELENKLALERMSFDLLVNEQKNTRAVLIFLSGNREL